jgi:hypothetical protein
MLLPIQQIAAQRLGEHAQEGNAGPSPPEDSDAQSEGFLSCGGGAMGFNVLQLPLNLCQ